MKHTIELQPFTVPNFAKQFAPVRNREDGWIETPAIPLSELSAETLEAMCAEFREGVFKKARKAKPRTEN